ncbi:MAG: GldG family protein [Kofleriaceae bacterium]|nr:GldG family protein [Kofleriaceae bacterium]
MDLARLLSLAFVAVLALCAAASVIGQSKTERNRFRIACIALVVAGASASSLAGKHWTPGDWTAHSVHTLDSSSRAVLASVRSPLEVVLVRPSDQVFDPVFEEVERLIARMVDSQPLLAIGKVDPLLQPEKIQEWAFELGIQASELSSGGAVIFVQDGRLRVVDFMAMADYSFDDLGVGSLSEFRAEAAFRQAIAEVTLRRRDKLCVTTGHGELESEVAAGLNNRARWTGAASRLRAEGVASTMLERTEKSALSDCDALLIHGPSKSFSAAELRALDAYLTGGGNALIALRSLPSLGAQSVPDLPFLDDGLKLLLAARGMNVLDAVVVDPEAVIDAPPEWMTYEGYGEHAIVRDFHQRRATLWLPPRALSASNDEVLGLLEASSGGWAEHDMTRYFSDGGYEKSDEDTADIAIALVHENANKGRLVLFGSAESLSDHWGSRGVGGNERLLVAACLWTLHRDMQLSLPSKELEHLHLVMSQTQLRDAFIYMVILGPLLFALLGALCWWWRRREE